MTVTELQTVAAQVDKASCYLDVFGQTSSTPALQKRRILETYRQLARVLHPDKYCNPADKQLASDSFAKLAKLKSDADEAVANKLYGKPVQLLSIRTKKAEHRLIKPGPTGDLTDVFVGTTTIGGKANPALFKVARHVRDNDLLKAEASALKRLHGANTDSSLHPYVPELLDSLTYTAAKGKAGRQLNALNHLAGFYNLAEVRQAFPGGLNPLDMVWMWRRLLTALGFAHENNLVHGAVLPEHVLIHPEMHGLVLADWCYASVGEAGEPFPAIKAVVDKYRPWYPDEVLHKQPPSPATDITMAARCMVQLCGGNPLAPLQSSVVPRPLRAFFAGCLLQKQSARPDNAWALLKEFDELLERMGKPFYPRRFRPFAMP